MKKYITKILLVSIFFLTSFIFSSLALAHDFASEHAHNGNNFSVCTDANRNETTGCTNTNSNEPTESLPMDNPIGGTDVNINFFIGNMINYIMGIVGSLFLLFFVYGGLIWMTSAGSAEKVGKAKSIMVWNTLGMFVIFGSYALVKLILSTLK